MKRIGDETVIKEQGPVSGISDVLLDALKEIKKKAEESKDDGDAILKSIAKALGSTVPANWSVN